MTRGDDVLVLNDGLKFNDDEVAEERIVEVKLLVGEELDDVSNEDFIYVLLGVYVARKQGQADDRAETVAVGPQFAK